MPPKKDTEAAKKAATNKKAAATKKTAATHSKNKTTIEISSDEPSEVSDSLMCLSKREEIADQGTDRWRGAKEDEAYQYDHGISDEPSEVSYSLTCLSKRDERWLTKVQNDDAAGA